MTPQPLESHETRVRLQGVSRAHSGVVIHVSPHAAARYHERVRPSLDADSAAGECAQLIAGAVLQTEPPAWLGPTRQRPAYYICIGDLAMPADPDPGSRDRLIVRTVLARGNNATPRRSRRRERRLVKATHRQASREQRAKRDLKRRQRSGRRAARRSTINRDARTSRRRARHAQSKTSR